MLALSIIYSNCCHKYKKILEEKESIEILKILGLITNIKENISEISEVSENIFSCLKKHKPRI